MPVTDRSRVALCLTGAIAIGAFMAMGANSRTFGKDRTAAPVQASEDRVELIMGGLPPAGSPGYQALRRLAGRDAKGQILELTKCEVWTVRRSLLPALKQAASERNVSVKELDSNWNSLFTSHAANAPMAPQAKAMTDLAMQSKATAGMGMMSARTSSMVEYALTKGMGDRTAQQSPRQTPMTIRIALNDRTTVTAVRTSVVISGDRCIWRGVVEGTENPVTIMWWASGRITGTVHTGARLYQLKHLGPDLIGIVETMVDKLPDEHAKASAQRMQDMKIQQDPLVMEGDASKMRPKRTEVDDARDANDPQTAKRSTVPSLKLDSAPVPSPKKKGVKASAPSTAIDVMVAYTAKATAHYSDIRRDLIELAIEETNQSFRASKIKDVEVRLVHAHETGYKEEGAEHFDHVWRMVDRGDGFLEEIPRLRDEKKADVVILIVDDPAGCGLATRVAADPEEAYAVVHHECAATSYSIAHEIGHIIGARHDRSLDRNAAPFPNGHGYVSPDFKWRTMMSYKAACNGCPRLPIWSTPEKIVNGQAAGDAEHDNAGVVREQAARVSAFR